MPARMSEAAVKRLSKNLGIKPNGAVVPGDPAYDPEYLLNTMLGQARKLSIELPEFHKEFQFAKYFNRNFRFDICWILSKLAVEFDGHQHKRHGRWVADAEKSQWASALGWRIIHVTEKQLLDNPEPFFKCLLMALKECSHTIPQPKEIK